MSRLFQAMSQAKPSQQNFTEASPMARQYQSAPGMFQDLPAPGYQTPPAGSLYNGGAYGSGSSGFGSGASGGQGNYNATITPSAPYTSNLTQYGQNQIMASAAQQSDPNFLAKQYDRPGVSRDEGTMGLVAPQAGMQMGQAQSDSANLGLNDYLTNQKSLLAGETARENEGLGLGNLGAAMNQSNISFNNQNSSRLFQLLNGMI